MTRRVLCLLCVLVLVLGVGVSPAAATDGRGTAPSKPAPSVPVPTASGGNEKASSSAVGAAGDVSPAIMTDDLFPGMPLNFHWMELPYADTLTDTSDEHDWWKVYLEAGEYYYFELDPDVGLDFDLYMWGPGTQTLYNSSAVFGDFTEWIEGTVTTEGYYFIEAREWAGSGAYNLDAEVGNAADDNIYVSPGFYTPGLTAGGGSGSVTFYLDGYSEFDEVRRIWLWPGDSISLSLSTPSYVGNFNPSIYLYGPAATDIWTSSAVAQIFTGPYPRVLNYTATTAGYHYIDIYETYVTSSWDYGYARLDWAANYNLVYRFYNPKNGTHFFTATEAEKANVIANLSHIYQYEGPSYRVDPAMNTDTIWRFYKPSTGTHFYTADPDEKNRVQTTMGNLYTYEGPAYEVSRTPGPGYMPVWRFFRPSTGTHVYTADPNEANTINTTLQHLYSLDGIAFYVGTGY